MSRGAGVGWDAAVARGDAVVARGDAAVARGDAVVARGDAVVARESTAVARRSTDVARGSTAVAMEVGVARAAAVGGGCCGDATLGLQRIETVGAASSERRGAESRVWCRNAAGEVRVEKGSWPWPENIGGGWVSHRGLSRFFGKNSRYIGGHLRIFVVHARDLSPQNGGKIVLRDSASIKGTCRTFMICSHCSLAVKALMINEIYITYGMRDVRK